VLARAATDRLVALSDTVRRAHAEALGLPCSRIDVVHPGVPSAAPAHPEQLAALRRELRLGDAYPVLLSVGRIEANKGQRDLVPMLARVVSRFPSARLLVAGDGEDREPLAVAMAAAGLDRHATVLGRRDDVAALAEVADMLLSTAHHEGFGMAVLEAMAAGCAVAAYDNDFVAIREFVTDGVSGRLVPEDPAALADAVVGLAADRARLVATGVAARDAAGRFSAARSAQRYGEIYRELALSRPARPHHRLPRKPGC
jgi:glycosyltransferase involved in cell wall biosynthesis